MPDIDSLLEKASKKKFKKSSYRPWNYMDEIQKEEDEKNHKEEVINSTELKQDYPPDTSVNKTDVIITSNENTKLNISNTIREDLIKVSAKENTQIKNESHEDKWKESSDSPLYSILRLSGHQKTIFAFILERCLSRGLLSSGMITSEMIISITKTSLSMVNTSIQRLVNKKLVFRQNGKRGRGGFYCFGLSQEVKDAAIEYRRLATLDSSEPLRTESQMENCDLIRIDGRKFSTPGLPQEWEELDIEPLNHIGFSRGHLVQLFKQGDLEAQSIQDSIYHFAYDLKYNNKGANITKSSPIGYFMGILKRSAIYNAPDNYESPKDRALRELLEQKKAQKEKRDAVIKELINIAFDDWQAKLSQGEKDQLIPEEIRKGRLTGAKLASLKSYFTENIWPQVAPKQVDI